MAEARPRGLGSRVVSMLSSGDFRVPSGFEKQTESNEMVHPAIVIRIVRIQRAFRERQAAKQAVEEQQRMIVDDQHANSRAQLHELERERRSQSAAQAAADGTMGFDSGSRPRYGAANYKQYRDQMQLMQVGAGSSLPARCFRGEMHPFEPTRVWWDGVIFVLLLYTSVWEPFKAAFLNIDSLSLWDVAVDAVFWIDILLSFSTGYETEDRLRVDFRRKSIVQQYCTRPNGFFVDFIATVPWDAVLRIFEPKLGMRKTTYRMTRMVRLLRLLRAPRLINRLTENRNWAIHSVYIDFTKFTIYVLILAHVLACFFFLWPAVFVVECAPLPSDESLDDAGLSGAAATIDDADDCTPLGSWRDSEMLYGAPAEHAYVLAMYWSVTTITTIGFGDVTPVLQCEIIFTIFAEMFGMAFFALLVDQVVRLSDVLDNHRHEVNERKNQVIQFMDQNGLDDDFRERVLEFMQFRATSASRRNFDPQDPRFVHLSPAILDEMRTRVFRPILRAVALFNEESKVPQAFVDSLAMQITSDPFSPDETIVAQGMYGNALCIVLTGHVVISKSGVRRRLILSDDSQPVFGVSATLSEREFETAQTELADWSAESISYCDIARIDHDAFRLALSQSWPEGEQVMRRVARAELLRSDGLNLSNVLGDRVRSTVWVGNIPERYATKERVKQLMGQFGVIQSVTVRQKKGKNKSWSFVTFESPESAGKALHTSIDVYGETEPDGSQLYLKVKEADLESALAANRRKGGVVAAVLMTHAVESENHGQADDEPGAPSESEPPSSAATATPAETECASGRSSERAGIQRSAVSVDGEVASAYLTEQLVASMPLFQGLTLAERQALAKVLKSESYPDGYAIVNQGDKGDSMYILAVGRAVATMVVEIGAPPKMVRSYGSGDYFGELALLSNQPSTTSVCAQGPVICFTIGREQFETLSFSGRFLNALQNGTSRVKFAKVGSRLSPSKVGSKADSTSAVTSRGWKRVKNVSLAELKQARQGSQHDLASMLLSTSDEEAPLFKSGSDLRTMWEQQVHLRTELETVNSSVKELREEMAERFDRLEKALLGKQP